LPDSPVSFLAFSFLSGSPNILDLAVWLFMATVGIIMADVSADTIIVERSKYEPEHKKGTAQATCYSVRFFGGMLGALGGEAGAKRQQKHYTTFLHN